MASPFDSLTLDQIQAALSTATLGCAATNRHYYDGDHWQGGTQWMGPRPDGVDPDTLRVISEIAKAFTPQNAIAEVVDRHADGVIGKEPAWGFTVRRPLKEGKQPTRAEQSLIDEAEAAITSWWDERKGLSLYRKLARTLLLAGRAPLRLYVPSGLRALDLATQTPVVPTASTLEQALERLYLDLPDPKAAMVLTDAATQQRCGVYVYAEGGQTVAELTYVDMTSGKTVLRILRSGGKAAAESWDYELDGHLLLDEATREALVSEPIRRLQNQLNVARTMSGRNIIQGGFLERIILNGQMPGSYVDDPTMPADTEGKRRRFIPRPLRTGAGKTNFISGQAIRDKEGNITSYTPASVVFRDPVSTKTFEEAVGANYRSILQDARQLHALMSGDSTASGTSRIQARADFAKSLGPTKIELDALGRWLIETVLALAAVFAKTPGKYDGLRATFDCRIDTGPMEATERAQIVTEVEKGMLSLETALAMLGHDDVAAELARIAAEKAERQAQAAALAAPTDPNAPADPNQPGQSGQGQGGQQPSTAQRPSAQGAAQS